MDDILAKILAEKDNLTKKEQRLANYILRNPMQVVKLTIHEVAKESGVSAATIIRFCKSLGIDGYGKLRLMISATRSKQNFHNYQEITANESSKSIIQKMGTHFEAVIHATETNLDSQQVDEAVKLLHRAKQIEVFGIGAAGIVARDFYQKMIRIGCSINFFSDFHMALTQLVSLSKDSVLVLVSNSGETYEVIEIAKIVKKSKKKIPIVLITSDLNSTTSQMANVVLLNQDLGESKIRLGATTSLVSQMFIVDVLLFSYSATYLKQVSADINESKKIVDKYKLRK